MKHILIALWLSLFAVFVFHGCVVAPVAPTTAPVQQAGNCASVSESLALVGRTVVMPATGKLVLESHLATREDNFNGYAWPQSKTDQISAHLARSCNAYGMIQHDCDGEIYTTVYHHEWTPQEGGEFGQGSVGNLKPTVQEEMWGCNMNWGKGSKPSPGTRFLAKRGNNSVVVAMGYETGPSDASYVGGCQGEVIHILGGQDSVTISRLKDQTLGYGPIDCK